MKNNIFFILTIFLVTTLLFFVSADVISINSGGDNQLIINPDSYIEGFFFMENTAPYTSIPLLSSLNGRNESDTNLNCSFYVYDSDAYLGTLNASVKWIKNDVLQFTLNYNNDYSNATNINSILDSGNLTLGETWKCSVRDYDGYEYSSWLDSNELTIIDITDPEIYIVSPLSNSVYNYTTLAVDFNISIIENENISMCFYSLESAANVTMMEINDSYFWYEPNLGPGPQTVEFYCNDSSGNWGYNSTLFEILNEAAIAIDLSTTLETYVKWNVVSLPVDNLDAEGNNGSGLTEYWVNISVTNTLADLYVRADGDLFNDALDVLGLGNETFTFTKNEPTVNNNTNTTMSTTYILIGEDLEDLDVVYLKFFLDAPAVQPAGTYLNSLDFKAVRAGQSP